MINFCKDNMFRYNSRRKISFKQFKDALERLAKVKYPDDPEAFEKLKAKILEGKGPQTHSAVSFMFVIKFYIHFLAYT